MLTDLGPSFIKAGQVLASRPDIVREDYMNELCTLQDDVPSFPDQLVGCQTSDQSQCSKVKNSPTSSFASLLLQNKTSLHCSNAYLFSALMLVDAFMVSDFRAQL